MKTIRTRYRINRYDIRIFLFLQVTGKYALSYHNVKNVEYGQNTGEKEDIRKIYRVSASYRQIKFPKREGRGNLNHSTLYRHLKRTFISGSPGRRHQSYSTHYRLRKIIRRSNIYDPGCNGRYKQKIVCRHDFSSQYLRNPYTNHRSSGKIICENSLTKLIRYSVRLAGTRRRSVVHSGCSGRCRRKIV